MSKITHTFSGLENSTTYYGKVFTVNPKGRVNNRADLPVFAAIASAFPSEPDSYELIDTYTSAQTWAAPEDGWFKIELFGASGSGGNGVYSSYEDSDGYYFTEATSGYSGAGGGYSLSEGVKMNKGDIIQCEINSAGTMTLNVRSSVDGVEIITMICTKGGDGQTAYVNDTGYHYDSYDVAVGGSASGGKTLNEPGKNGARAESTGERTKTVGPVAGGAAGHPDGNAGGASGTANYSSSRKTNGEARKPAFFRISRGNTNVVG